MKHRNRRHINVLDWISPASVACLDVGCNVGELLAAVARHCDRAVLVGVDMNREALERARRRNPGINFTYADICHLPFESDTFDVVTCVEVIEHVERERRADAFREMRRVARRGRRLIVSTPHDGWFAWLDANNVRFRFPFLYRTLIGSGVKDLRTTPKTVRSSGMTIFALDT